MFKKATPNSRRQDFDRGLHKTRMSFSTYGFRALSGTQGFTRRTTRSKNCHGSHVLFARCWPTSSSARGGRAIQLGRAQQFPPQMIHVKDEDRLRVLLPEML